MKNVGAANLLLWFNFLFISFSVGKCFKIFVINWMVDDVGD